MPRKWPAARLARKVCWSVFRRAPRLPRSSRSYRSWAEIHGFWASTTTPGSATSPWPTSCRNKNSKGAVTLFLSRRVNAARLKAFVSGRETPAKKVQECVERASVGEALWFDVRSSDSAGDDSLLASRVSGLDHTAIVLAATHLLTGLAFVTLHGSGPAGQLFSLTVPLLLVLLLDVTAAAALHFRDRFGFKPNAVIRGMCSYMLAIGLLWTMVGVQAAAPEHADHWVLPFLMIGGGAAMAAIVGASSPPL